MTTITPPKKLAFFYGWPSTVNGAGSVAGAVAIYKEYDQLVFGTGLEDPAHPDHANMVAIIAHPDMANTDVFGYIDATLSVNDVQGKIDQWAVTGIKGIFFDQFGYDFGVGRQKQREIVWCVQNKNNGLKTFVNAWNVDDVFSPAVDATHNPAGLPTRLGPNDLYLAESFAIVNGAYDDADADSNGIKDFQDKADKMKTYKNTFGTSMTAVTTNDASAFDQAKADYSYLLSVINEFDSWGWGEEFFSSSSSSLPFRTRATYDGTKFTGALVKNTTTGVIERDTNIGIKIDTVGHVVSNLLDC